ncbi:MAG: HlyD family efflux transporter periplasmic adaptor subunit [Acidobacteriota bacterium]|nr:HlyD family efflux transporter periplasmic adaptor subunit [Acidobacteriota bacterium]
MKRTLIFSTIAILLTIVSLGYFYWIRPSQIEQKVSTPMEEKQSGANKNIVAAPGVVEAISEEIEVGAEIAGKLKTVSVEEGDEVVKGQVIAVLENSEFEAQVATAKREIETLRRRKETARAKLAQAEADRARIANGARPEERQEAKAGFEQTLPVIENARKEAERRQKLFASGDISREELDRAMRELKVAETKSRELKERFNVVNADARKDDLDKANAAIRFAETEMREFDALISQANARVREAEARLAQTVVVAPISGVVLRKRLKTGESVSPENPLGIVTLADTSALRVRVDLDENDVAKIKENQTAYITADAFGEQKFAAKVVKIGQTMGRKNFKTERPTEKVDTKILEVLLELAPDQKLPLGLRVDAFIEVEK